MFFNSIKEINRLRKETNRLWSKGMTNIYQLYYWEKPMFSKLQFSKFKKFVIELQLKNLSSIILIFKGSIIFYKVKESIHFVKQKYKF